MMNLNITQPGEIYTENFFFMFSNTLTLPYFSANKNCSKQNYFHWFKPVDMQIYPDFHKVMDLASMRSISASFRCFSLCKIFIRQIKTVVQIYLQFYSTYSCNNEQSSYTLFDNRNLTSQIQLTTTKMSNLICSVFVIQSFIQNQPAWQALVGACRIGEKQRVYFQIQHTISLPPLENNKVIRSLKDATFLLLSQTSLIFRVLLWASSPMSRVRPRNAIQYLLASPRS